MCGKGPRSVLSNDVLETLAKEQGGYEVDPEFDPVESDQDSNKEPKLLKQQEKRP